MPFFLQIYCLCIKNLHFFNKCGSISNQRKGGNNLVLFQGGFMKKKLLGMIVIVTLVFLSTINNVYAANTYVDEATCKNGEVYTNYYFFLDASEKMTKDYTTIGYYQNVVLDPSLEDVVNEYGIFSEEFSKVANRGYGVVPINTNNKTLSISTTGVGLKTFYRIMIYNKNSMNVEDNSIFLTEHNWSRVQNQIVKETNTNSLTFTKQDLDDMVDATVMLNEYPTISPIFNLSDDNTYSVQIQISRKYSEGVINNYRNITPLGIVSNNVKWNAYLQPALFYVQYCAKNTKKSSTLVLHYDGNAGSDIVTNVPDDQKFNSGDSTQVSKVVPTREGYTFLGWSDNADDKVANEEYKAGNKVYESMTLYAIWKKNEITDVYSIVYRPNTTDIVNNMPTSVTKSISESTTISEIIPVRNGYTFLGWSSVSGATSIEEKYNGGSTYSEGKDLILYAVWKKNDSSLPDNPKTGVKEYIVPFSGVIVASGFGLKVLKKKKSFMQF